MLKNKWFYSGVFILIFSIFLYFNLDNNSFISPNQSTDLSNVTNEEMEQVIKLNPDIFL